MTIKKITLNHITKVEGHAEVDISIKDGKVVHCHVHSVEGARYFEDIIKGRKYDEVALITSRICGICSCAHTIASIMAVENAFGIVPTLQDRLLRELLTIGERIRSHASHLYFFALPDYLGFGNAIDMAKEHPQALQDCLEIIRTGNELVTLIGGRDMHPFVPVVGGFTQVKPPESYRTVRLELEKILPLVERTIDLFVHLQVPAYEKTDTVFLSLDNEQSFPLLSGNLITNTGKKVAPEDYKKFISEHFHEGSSSKFASIEGKEFMTGALARLNNSFDYLGARTKELIKTHDFPLPNVNLFHNNTAQAFEIQHWLERAIEILGNHDFKTEAMQMPKLTKKTSCQGISAIEAPRGILFHDYVFNEKGILTEANIITPTVQNLADMEINVRTYLNQVLAKNPRKSRANLTLEIEKMIRAFDPCFSCSTHFLRVNWWE